MKRSVKGLQWILKPLPSHVPPGLVGDVANASAISEVLARSVILRGGTSIDAAQQFLEPSWDHVLPPDRMHGMLAADERLREVFSPQPPELVNW